MAAVVKSISYATADGHNHFNSSLSRDFDDVIKGIENDHLDPNL